MSRLYTHPSRSFTSSVVVALAALLTSSMGCSLVIDSGQYVAEVDAGPRDMGGTDLASTDSGDEDMGVVDQGGADQGPVICNNVQCEAGQFCLNDQLCADCRADRDCGSGLCDPAVGVCVGAVASCADCRVGTFCTDHPGGGGKVCLSCDRDEDGFASSWAACNSVLTERPRDCNDLDAQQYPNAAPVCADGFLQGCPSPAFDGVLTQLGGSFAELGRVPVHRVAASVAPLPQLSTIARQANASNANEDTNAARWVFGFVNAGEAELHSVQYRRDDHLQPVPFHAVGGPLSFSSAVVFDAGEVQAFTVDQFAGQLRFGVTSKIGGATRSALIGETGSGQYALSSSVATEGGFMPPMAIIGGTSADVIYRVDRLSVNADRRLVAQGTGQHTGLTTVLPGTPNFVLDTAGGYAFYTPSGRLTGEVWDGVATTGVNTGGPAGSLMSGPARFSADPGNSAKITGILPYVNGVRVIRFDCSGPGLDLCTSTATAIQPMLSGLVVFDFQVYNGIIYLFSANNGRVVADVFTLDNSANLIRQTPQSIVLIDGPDVGQSISSVLSIETDIEVGSNHVEIVIGAAVDTDTAGVHILGTSLRACSIL